MPDDKLSQFSESKYISIETYKKNGTGVRTPVWFIIHQGLIYFRTDKKSGKVKRLKNNPHVKIAPCDIRGNIKKEWLDGKAHFANSEESSIAYGMIGKKYGVRAKLVRIVNKIRGKRPVVLAILLNNNSG
ncbi:MAG TPA: PPOX class F420-dependent oxidoreductase [Nitrososphaeraceae archaeon]|jgi:PPOX class probable F420-dependent enzyme